jgi:hypothetical protein
MSVVSYFGFPLTCLRAEGTSAYATLQRTGRQSGNTRESIFELIDYVNIAHYYNIYKLDFTIPIPEIAINKESIFILE